MLGRVNTVYFNINTVYFAGGGKIHTHRFYSHVMLCNISGACVRLQKLIQKMNKPK